MKKLFLILLLSFFFIPFFIFAGIVDAATYNYYFSDDATGNATGNDSNNCTATGTACKTLTKAWQLIASANSDDTVNLYFDRGDTWNFNTGQNSNWVVAITDPVVNIDAYGSGDKPTFDGNVSGGDFSAVPANGIDGYNVTKAAFLFRKQNCSMKNTEIQNVYGVAIRVTSGFTFSGNSVHNLGYSGFTKINEDIVTGVLVEKNEFYTLMESYREGKVSYWSGGINIYCDGSSCSDWYDNTIRYNVVYDVYGEGIQGGNAIIEYNVVGDTGSVGIYPVPSINDAHDTIVRYNLVTMSSSPTYKTFSGSTYKGIEVRDENLGGSNSNATIEVYGNTVINRKYGILFDEKWGASAFGEVRFFNNTVIDSDSCNFIIGTGYAMVAAGKGFWYNNASILYDRTGATHAADWGNPGDLSTYWTIDNNAYWTTGGSPTVDVDWRTNYVTTDPKLAGEEQGSPVDWDGQSGATYFSDIEFSHIYPNTDSGLIGAGKTLSGFEETFLTLGTDFGDLPNTATFETSEQSYLSAWDIGAAIRNLCYNFSPDNNDTGVAITVDPTWVNSSEVTGVDGYFDKNTNPPTTKVIDNANVETYNPGTLDYDSNYYWKVNPKHVGGTETGQVYHFTTTSQANPPTPEGAGMVYHKQGAKIIYGPKGMSVE